ncbi:hypothetical protein ACFYSI_13130 [Staphylococcus xylosus]|uniref:hypothetical protein n=1 Tax=Staphylococcus xylosus TaxID=1288 RepID=UPI0036AC5CC3
MSDFNKKELEDVYSTAFTDLDINIINERMIYDTVEELETETRYFESLQSYVEYVYLSDFQSAKLFINDVVTSVNHNLDIRISDLILSDSDDIELANGRYILVMD